MLVDSTNNSFKINTNYDKNLQSFKDIPISKHVVGSVCLKKVKR